MGSRGFGRVVAALVCVLSFGAVSCSSRFVESEQTGSVGTLTSALTAVGSDGATYSFPPGTMLLVSSGGRTARFPLTGPEPLFSKTLPVGSYTLGIAFGQGGSPHLIRQTPSDTSAVDVEWTDPQPITFSIAHNVTTAITLSFNVPLHANVKFDTGKLEVGAEVTPDPRGTPSRFKFIAHPAYGGMTLTSVSFADPSAAYATALAATVGDVESFAVRVSTTGTWTTRVDAACVPVAATNQFFDGTGSTLDLRLEQLRSGLGEVCIVDEGATDVAELQLSISGPPPTEQVSFLPNATYIRELRITAHVGDFFDGETLHLEQLNDGDVASTDGTFRHRLADAANTTMTVLEGTVASGIFGADP